MNEKSCEEIDVMNTYFILLRVHSKLLWINTCFKSPKKQIGRCSNFFTVNFEQEIPNPAGILE